LPTYRAISSARASATTHASFLTPRRARALIFFNFTSYKRRQRRNSRTHEHTTHGGAGSSLTARRSQPSSLAVSRLTVNAPTRRYKDLNGARLARWLGFLGQELGGPNLISRQVDSLPPPQRSRLEEFTGTQVSRRPSWSWRSLQAALSTPTRTKTETKTKLLIDAFVASPPEPLRVSEFQTHHRTRLDEARAVHGFKVLGFG
jgi:hypothetical protein